MPDLLSLSTSAAQEAQDRRRQMLRTAFGPTIAAALADPAVLEVMVNPDGRLWIDRAGSGRADSGSRLAMAEVERIIRLVAAHVRREVTDKAPIVSAELPESGGEPMSVVINSRGPLNEQTITRFASGLPPAPVSCRRRVSSTRRDPEPPSF